MGDVWRCLNYGVDAAEAPPSVVGRRGAGEVLGHVTLVQDEADS